jgi:hypothetical protein
MVARKSCFFVVKCLQMRASETPASAAIWPRVVER